MKTELQLIQEAYLSMSEMVDYKTMSVETLRKHQEKHRVGLSNAKTQTKKLHHINQLGIIKDVLKERE